MGLFGPSQKEIWNEFAGEIEANFIEGGLFKSHKVIAKYENWEVTFDIFTQSSGKHSTTYTRIRAPFVSKGGFFFKLYNNGFFSSIGKTLGMQDIEIGFPEFDEKFIIKGKEAEKITELFSGEKIRELINSQNKIHLEIKDDEGMFGTEIPPDVDILYFQTYGVIKDIEKLKRLYMLFVLILNKLKLMDLAIEINPEDKIILK